jgi:hypothetical protein
MQTKFRGQPHPTDPPLHPDRMTAAAIQTFIARWTKSGGAERANYVSYFN